MIGSKPLRHWGWAFLLACMMGCATGSGGTNATDQRDKPTLILVSIDGFRWDYQDLYATPTLDWIADNGVRADALLPVFPTLTFPNHYSIATGLYPANHNLVGNRFPNRDRSKFYSLSDSTAVQDGSWYGGRPIWVAAEESGMVSAAYFFVGTEAPVNDVPMTYWHQFDASVPGVERVQQVLDWLALPDTKRPHMITLYFEDVDTATHNHGPGSVESIESIERVDAYLKQLMAGIGETAVADSTYVIVVSDHGQSSFKQEQSPFIIDDVVNLDDMIVVDHGTAAFLYLKKPDVGRARSVRDAINAKWNHGKAYTRQDMPTEWHVPVDSNFADITLQAEPGFSVASNQSVAQHSSKGDHGWAPDYEAMHGIFLATGPRLPKGKRISALQNIDVYPLMMDILGLPITTPIDGNRETLPALLIQ